MEWPALAAILFGIAGFLLLYSLDKIEDKLERKEDGQDNRTDKEN